jgi:FkbM family methyltransferase
MKLETIGTLDDGEFITDTSDLNAQSIVYSFGVGDHMSWEVDLIKKFGCTVYAFDPDPRAIAWLKTQTLSPQFIFTPEGIGARDGVQRFYDPYNPKTVAMSAIRKNKTFIDLPVKRLKTFMEERGHTHIDLIKMDIEGSEFNVILDIANLPIRQIIVELHTRFFHGWKGLKPWWGRWKTWRFFHVLKRNGFRLVHIDEPNYNYIFLRS